MKPGKLANEPCVQMDDFFVFVFQYGQSNFLRAEVGKMEREKSERSIDDSFVDLWGPRAL